MKKHIPPEESSSDTPQTLPQAHASDPAVPSFLKERGRAWLILLISLVVVFVVAWLLGFFNV